MHELLMCAGPCGIREHHHACSCLLLGCMLCSIDLQCDGDMPATSGNCAALHKWRHTNQLWHQQRCGAMEASVTLGHGAALEACDASMCAFKRAARVQAIWPATMLRTLKMLRGSPVCARLFVLACLCMHRRFRLQALASCVSTQSDMPAELSVREGDTSATAELNIQCLGRKRHLEACCYDRKSASGVLETRPPVCTVSEL